MELGVVAQGGGNLNIALKSEQLFVHRYFSRTAGKCFATRQRFPRGEKV
jgi:hypothetical protein